MYRGTTPTCRFILPDCVDITQANDVYVTFSKENGAEIITKTGNDLEMDHNYVAVFLTQEETLSFPKGIVMAQLNWLYDDDGVTKRACSNIIKIQSLRNLKNEVL